MSASKRSQKSQANFDAQRRAELILKVISKECTATDAAAEMGVSRKNYYRWEKRAFKGMIEALAQKDSGRPKEPPEVAEIRRLRDFIEYLEGKLDKSRRGELLIRRACKFKIREIKGELEKKSGSETAG